MKSILNPRLGNIKAAKLTTEPGTVNRELGLVRRAFQLGCRHDPPLVGRVPSFPKLLESEPRKGFLKPELYRKLLIELPEDMRLLFVIAYRVGLRKGTLLRIKWEQVGLNAGCIWIQEKNRTANPSRRRSDLRRHGEAH